MRHIINGFLRIFTWGKYPSRLDAIRLRIADKDADAKAIASDWQASGDDLRNAIREYLDSGDAWGTEQETKESIRAYEKMYGMDTEEMLSRMKTGELDSFDFMAWAGMAELLKDGIVNFEDIDWNEDES